MTFKQVISHQPSVCALYPYFHTASSGQEADRIAAGIHHIDVLILNHWIPPETGPLKSCKYQAIPASIWMKKAAFIPVPRIWESLSGFSKSGKAWPPCSPLSRRRILSLPPASLQPDFLCS
jgi:hypothetical protein